LRFTFIPHYRRIVLASFCFLLATLESWSQTSYFYKGRDFGSESQYSPLSLLLNGSYDIIQIDKNRNIWSMPYRIGFQNVMKNLGDPFTSIRDYGLRSFVRDEIFPFSFQRNNAQWFPNYTLHLIGGGMTYRAMTEWYEQEGISNPVLLSLTTMAVYHLGNEIVENQGYEGRTVDPIADIYVFDIGGILLFSSEGVCKFFSSTLNLADWSLQPSIWLRNGQLHNNGQYFSMKWKLPFWDRWYVHYFFGLNGVTGLSYRFSDGDAFSVGYGLSAGTLTVIDDLTNKKTISFVETIACFFDRDNSLLGSMVLTRKTNYSLSINIYPGLVDIWKIKVGAWFVLNRQGGSLIGVTTRYAPGIAF
jgi:hypothetical protein